jgi:hypothetical protein
MTTDSFFALAITAMIAMFFGFVLSFSGYRFFLILLPIFGFFYGFGLGAHSIQALFGGAFLATVTGWVIGFLVGVVFAVLSYLFYLFGVALIAGALGYSVGVGLMMAIGFDFGFLAWVVGIVLGIVCAVGAIALNIQKWIIVIATSLLGAGVIVGTFLFIFGGLPSAQVTQNPVRYTLQTSPFWLFIFFLIAGLGIAAQYATTRRLEIETYDRLSDMSSEPAPASGR